MRSTLARGALAGLVATAPMTAVLELAFRRRELPEYPPATISREVAPGAYARSGGALAAGVHVAIGAGSGMLFALAGGLRRHPLPVSLLGGCAQALVTWAAGYLVVAPAVGALPQPHRDRRDRQRAIALAHLVFGVALGVLARPVAGPAGAASPGPRRGGR
ncbi:MAG: hypothetical protein HY996_04845 [Micrococcales bacterium]|nr:hypothetical protein [Micrococcales bacterium]